MHTTRATVTVLLLGPEVPDGYLVEQALASNPHTTVRMHIVDSLPAALSVLARWRVDLVLLGLSLPASLRAAGHRQVLSHCRGALLAEMTGWGGNLSVLNRSGAPLIGMQGAHCGRVGLHRLGRLLAQRAEYRRAA